MFGAVKWTKHVDVDLYKYCRYSIGFDRKGSYSIGDEVVIFGVDMSLSLHVHNKKRDILTLGKGPTQQLEHALAAEKLYSINFTIENTKFSISMHYNGANSYAFVNGTKIIKFKANDSEIAAYSLCLGNISKDWSVDKIKKTWLKGFVYDFSVHYDAIAVNDILDIHRYLMKKNEMV